ncbi:MAG: RsmG family class I SAM-dependent methyltransferase [Candidatus Zipacnadales bacterium]
MKHLGSGAMNRDAAQGNTVLCLLRNRAREAGFPIRPDMEEALVKWAHLVIEWRKAAQLTGLRCEGHIVTELIIPALYALKLIELTTNSVVVDFGCGNGCTGAALAAAQAQGHWLLVDSDTRKVIFCRYACSACRIPGLEALTVDEAFERGTSADIVLARAVPWTEQVKERIKDLLVENGKVLRWVPSYRVGRKTAVRCGESAIWVVVDYV